MTVSPLIHMLVFRLSILGALAALALNILTLFGGVLPVFALPVSFVCTFPLFAFALVTSGLTAKKDASGWRRRPSPIDLLRATLGGRPRPIQALVVGSFVYAAICMGVVFVNADNHVGGLEMMRHFQSAYFAVETYLLFVATSLFWRDSKTVTQNPAG